MKPVAAWAPGTVKEPDQQVSSHQFDARILHYVVRDTVVECRGLSSWTPYQVGDLVKMLHGAVIHR